MKLTVNLGKNSYPVYIENYILRKAGEVISENFSGKRIMIVSDDNVYPLYGDILEKTLAVLMNAIISYCLTAKPQKVSDSFRKSTAPC